MLILFSERIKLIALDYKHLQLQSQSWSLMEQSLGVFPIIPSIEADYLIELEDALHTFWLPKVAENPNQYAWYTAWQIVHLEKNVIIGGIGLMGLPDENGQTMTGYHIDNHFHKQGFASEALRLLSHWAFEHPDLKSITATTFSSNIPSQRVLEKNGFKKTNEEGEMIHWELRKV